MPSHRFLDPTDSETKELRGYPRCVDCGRSRVDMDADETCPGPHPDWNDELDSLPSIEIRHPLRLAAIIGVVATIEVVILWRLFR